MPNLLEPAITGAHSNIEDEIEILIERRVHVGGILPRILEESRILDLRGEIASLPEIFARLEAHEEDLHEAAVEIRVDVVLGPLDPERVILLGVVCTTQRFAVGRSPVGVCRGRWAPVEGAGHYIAAGRDAVDFVAVAVAAALGDVYFATAGPVTVGTFLRKHPVALVNRTTGICELSLTKWLAIANRLWGTWQ